MQSLPLLIAGLGNTLLLCVLAMAVSAVAGHAVLFLRLSRWAVARGLARAYVSLMRGTPALVQLFVLFFALPLIGAGGHPLLAAVLAIGCNSAAYVGEILRANLPVVSQGQREAAAALGMAPRHTWQRIIGPQVWRASLPALVNEFTILLKTTPLASVVGVTELAYAGQMVSARTFRQDEVLVVVAVCYLAITLPTIALARRLERRLHADPTGGDAGRRPVGAIDAAAATGAR
ncbi:polar amino acid ABC transporter permease [Rhodoferax koreense]|uniref:Polar amino acid ABC transporter permease n=1 Tax=Rhodoferax koreensis TaxID=1842727 RepID=A0A1P8K0T8_9BURK|nr:amino acid ABC transporter permease [Rhodoferax koreense]APW39612.1 polar amino acid ABC transporter permease [Rhodoferax koreense]